MGADNSHREAHLGNFREQDWGIALSAISLTRSPPLFGRRPAPKTGATRATTTQWSLPKLIDTAARCPDQVILLWAHIMCAQDMCPEQPEHRLRGSNPGSLSLRLSALLGGPGPSGGAGQSRHYQGCFPPSPALPGSGCPQLRWPAATGRRWSLFISTRLYGASWRTWRPEGFARTASSDCPVTASWPPRVPRVRRPGRRADQKLRRAPTASPKSERAHPDQGTIAGGR